MPRDALKGARPCGAGCSLATSGKGVKKSRYYQKGKGESVHPVGRVLLSASRTGMVDTARSEGKQSGSGIRDLERWGRKLKK